jgi:hypothetical protein
LISQQQKRCGCRSPSLPPGGLTPRLRRTGRCGLCPAGRNRDHCNRRGTRLNHDGCETVIAHPLSPGSLAIGLLLGGGPLLYVATQTWFLRVTTKNQLTRRWIACAILATTIPIGAVLPALAALGLVAVTLATLAAYAPRHLYTPSV